MWDDPDVRDASRGVAGIAPTWPAACLWPRRAVPSRYPGMPGPPVMNPSTHQLVEDNRAFALFIANRSSR